MQRVIGIGETVLDILFKNDQPQKAVPGGSTFNSIVSLGRAGVSCAMITQTGSDHIGDMICDFLRKNGVSDEFVCRKPNTKSHITLAFLNEHNDAQYEFYKDHATDLLDIPLPHITADDIVLFGSFFAINPVIRPVTRKLLTEAHEAGAWLYYDVNFRLICQTSCRISRRTCGLRQLCVDRWKTSTISLVYKTLTLSTNVSVRSAPRSF